MSTEKYVIIGKEQLDIYLKELGKQLKKRVKTNGPVCELVLVGGASIIVNYGFRMSTTDIDCIDSNGLLMNDLISFVSAKYNLPDNWINTDFVNTKSYSGNLSKYSSFYKSYGNGILSVRTIKDEYLLAMKMVSARKYKNDFSDIYGIITECSNNGHPLTMEIIEGAIKDLYSSLDVVDDSALEFVKKILSDPSSIDYEEISAVEKGNSELIKQRMKNNNLNLQDIDYILEKIK